MKSILFLIFLTFGLQLSAQTIPDEYIEFYQEMEMVPYDEKFRMLDEVIEYYPEEPWFLWMKAGVYDMIGDHEQTVECYEKALALDSTFSGAHASYARFLSDDPDMLESALEHINKALKYEPDGYHYHIDRGEIYFEMKEYDKALEDAEYALEHTDPLYSAQLKIEILHAQNKRNELKEFLKTHDLSSDGEFLSTDFCLLLASIYEEMGEMNKACKLYRGAAEPYFIMDDELPEKIASKLEGCK